MSSDTNNDELAARKARNDAIRLERERQNAGTDTPADDESTTPPGGEATGPNYVKFIDRKMREGDKQDS